VCWSQPSPQHQQPPQHDGVMYGLLMGCLLKKQRS
jgi:hypothetical protein